MLSSTYRRVGEPVLVACGPSRVRGGLHVGLLYAASRMNKPGPGARPPDFERFRLADPNDPSIVLTVFIPEEYRNLPAPKWAANVTLEVIDG